MINVKLIQSLRRVEVSRHNKVFTSGHVYSMAHYKAIERKFKAWDRLGWPYILQGD